VPFVFVVVAAYRGPQGIVRQVIELGFLPPVGSVCVLMRRAGSDLKFEPRALAALAAWSGETRATIAAEIARRADWLDS